MKEDKVCEEVADAKAEIEKPNTKLSESVKEMSSEKLSKMHELELKMENRGRELIERAGEISSLRQLNEDIQCRMREKEDIVNNLKSANQKLRHDSDSKLKQVEVEKRDLATTLEAAMESNIKQERSICGLKEEIESLKEALSFSQRKCWEAEEKAKAVIELGKKGDMLLTSEEVERQKVKDELKWKSEQFNHLRDAHEQLREQFRANKKEWDAEKVALLDALVSLQTKLQSQIEISEDLETRLKMCSHALTNEESRRRCLEVQLLESKSCLENVSSECEGVKSKFQNLTLERDDEISNLRASLASRGALYKEMEYAVAKLEQENAYLLDSVKEIREAGIAGAGSFSFSSSSPGKMKNKPKTLKLESEVQREKDKIMNEINVAMGDLKQRVEMADGVSCCLRKEWEKIRRELREKEAEVRKLRIQVKVSTGKAKKMVEKNAMIRRLRQGWKKMKCELREKELEAEEQKRPVRDCEDEKRSALCDVAELRFEKESLMDLVGSLIENSSKYLNDDMELVGGILNMVSGEEEKVLKKGNLGCASSPRGMKPAATAISNQRSPFRVLNQ